MPRIKYTDRSLSESSMDIVHQANAIIARFANDGFDLTLRQLYYQFVAGDLFPPSWADKETGSTNNERSYKRLGDIISDARMAGLIDWEAIIDRTRALRSVSTWTTPAEIVRACAQQFKVDLWLYQRHRVEVWVEKDAAIGVVAGTCSKLRVPYFSCRGYTSQTAIWEAAMRLLGHIKAGRAPVVLHLGDHDPSGVDMSRDIQERLATFIDHHTPPTAPPAGGLVFERIALSMEQVRKYKPPPNPTKITDSRAKGYIREHGHTCWELDALEPRVVDQLIQRKVKAYIDQKAWNDMQVVEDMGREKLSTVADGLGGAA